MRAITDPSLSTDSLACAATRRSLGSEVCGIERVVAEAPVALVFNGISHAIMMATPMDLEVFGLGFALSEGIVEQGSDVYDVESSSTDAGAQAQLNASRRAMARLKVQRRSLVDRSGGGLCGIESLERLDLHPSPIAMVGAVVAIDDVAVAKALAELERRHRLMRETGGVHAAAWCDGQGRILELFEDAGRRNALDQLIGSAARRQRDLHAGFVLPSSRPVAPATSSCGRSRECVLPCLPRSRRPARWRSTWRVGQVSGCWASVNNSGSWNVRRRDLARGHATAAAAAPVRRKGNGRE